MKTEPRKLELSAPKGVSFTCSGCGDCCRKWPVPLTDKDIATIEALDWKALAPGAESFAVPLALGLGRNATILRQREDRGCIFLKEDQRCAIHEAHGASSKPLACRAFPFQFLELPADAGGPGQKKPKARSYAQIQFACSAASKGEGRPLKKQLGELRALRDEIQSTLGAAPCSGVLPFSEDNAYPAGTLDWFLGLLAFEVEDTKHSLSQRLLTLTRFIDLIAASRFSNMSEDKRVEFVLALLKGTRNQVVGGKVKAPEGKPAFPEMLLFRQLAAYRTLDHAPELQGLGLVGRRGLGLSRLIHAARWCFGLGFIRLPGGEELRVDRVRKAAPACRLDDAPVSEALTRYLSAQLGGRRLLGRSMRKASLLGNLGLLIRQLPIIMLIARAACLAREGEAVSARDMAVALRIADISIGTFPISGGVFANSRRRLLSDLRGSWLHLRWCCESPQS